MNKIPNSQLIIGDIPSSRASWKKIMPFALTFDGYEQWGSFQKCREVAQQGVDLYRSKKDLNLSLTDLRSCLFFETRRWRHFKRNPSDKGMDYIHALLEAIRMRVKAKEIN